MFVDDRTRLLHILDASRKACAFASPYMRDALDTNRMLYHAIKDCLITVGEAASNVSPELRGAQPEIDWRGLISLRNRLLRDYYILDADRIWNTVVNSLPGLIAQMEPLVASMAE
jgi:uncharacterized protein with HEPN domain